MLKLTLLVILLYFFPDLSVCFALGHGVAHPAKIDLTHDLRLRLPLLC